MQLFLIKTDIPTPAHTNKYFYHKQYNQVHHERPVQFLQPLDPPWSNQNPRHPPDQMIRTGERPPSPYNHRPFIQVTKSCKYERNRVFWEINQKEKTEDWLHKIVVIKIISIFLVARLFFLIIVCDIVIDGSLVILGGMVGLGWNQQKRLGIQDWALKKGSLIACSCSNSTLSCRENSDFPASWS